LLVAREIRYGHTRFQGIAMSTGAPRDVLTARLRKLEQAVVIERRQYSQRPPRHEYLLTDAGQALRPILLALKEWGRPIRQPRSRAGHLPTHLRRRVPTTDRLRRLQRTRP
jgi:DNA-binding HxlR family transcriptional regulator